MHRCPECGEPCDCHEILIDDCIHCNLCGYDEPIGDEMDDYDEDED